jgi:hypothetical protein
MKGLMLPATKSNEHVFIHAALDFAYPIGHIAEGDTGQKDMNQFEPQSATLAASIAPARIQAQGSRNLAIVRGDGGFHEVIADRDEVGIALRGVPFSRKALKREDGLVNIDPVGDRSIPKSGFLEIDTEISRDRIKRGVQLDEVRALAERRTRGEAQSYCAEGEQFFHGSRFMGDTR